MEGRLKLQDFYQEKDVIELAEAAAEGDIRRIDELSVDGRNINHIGRDGMTPLLWALMAKSKKVSRTKGDRFISHRA